MTKVRKCSCGKKMNDDEMVLFAIFKLCLHDNKSKKCTKKK